MSFSYTTPLYPKPPVGETRWRHESHLHQLRQRAEHERARDGGGAAAVAARRHLLLLLRAHLMTHLDNSNTLEA
jgi:hypothetical protein